MCCRNSTNYCYCLNFYFIFQCVLPPPTELWILMFVNVPKFWVSHVSCVSTDCYLHFDDQFILKFHFVHKSIKKGLIISSSFKFYHDLREKIFGKANPGKRLVVHDLGVTNFLQQICFRLIPKICIEFKALNTSCHTCLAAWEILIMIIINYDCIFL